MTSSWALFFTRFNFHISFRPGSGKADDLLGRFPASEPVEDPPAILLASLIAAPIEWDLHEEITQETRSQSVPQGCPPQRLFVPDFLHGKVIKWAHTLPASGHPVSTGGQK